MASNRGRGRGTRGRGKDLRVTPQGQAVGVAGKPKVPGSVEGLGTYLRSLNESNFKSYGGMFADMVLGYCVNESKLQEAVDLIFDTTVSDRDNAELGAKVCANIAMPPCGSSEGGAAQEPEAKSAIRAGFRKVLLKKFQAEYKKKEQLRTTSIETWLSVFAFLCDVYVRITIGGKPIVIIGKAILTTMDFLLNLSDVIDDEIDCICTSLKFCGKHLEQQSPQELKKVVNLLRTRAIASKTSCRVRCLILELLELRQMRWADPEKTLDEFYADGLFDAIAQDEVSGDTS